uniref:Uncharacterized protein n=1 Tax=Tanacetum cinerariifolium TaxID=118510 RepID=A0A6L2JKY8_TANCI|nr:hypothetical protein [Tanacetum cinerariifolium]
MPHIEKYVTVSLGAEVLVRSTNQPQTSYTVAASLSEFELKKILIDKMKTNKSINRLDIQKNLYKALVEAYNSEKDIITSYGDVVTLKRGRDDQGKDEDPFAGSDRWTKKESQARMLNHQKAQSQRNQNDRYDLGVALRMFTRRIVILHHVEDLQLGVKSYQKKLNITRLETFRSDIPNMIPYTAYKNHHEIIYQDNFQRYKLMRSDEHYKFCDWTLSSVSMVLHDIASRLEMDYLPKRHWSNLENKRTGGLPRDISLDSAVVLRYEKSRKSKNKGKMPTEMKLVLEQTQQGTSYEVLVSAEGVEELKRKVKIKGEKKEAPLHLGRNQGIVVIATVFDEATKKL